MKTNFTEHKSSKLSIPTVKINRHQQQLRRALLTSEHWNRRSSQLSNLLLFWKGGGKRMNYKRFALLGSIVVIVIVIVLTMTVIRSSSSMIYAKEIAQKSIETVTNLSDEEKLEMGIPTDAKSLLEEAQNAKDLTVLIYDQVKDMLPNESDPGVVVKKENSEQGLEEGTGPEKGLEININGNPEDGLAKLQQTKFLCFTNSQGAKVYIGVDQDNLPIFTNVSFGK